MKFKFGDWVKNISMRHINNTNFGKIGVVIYVYEGNIPSYDVKYEDGSNGNGFGEDYVLIRSIKNYQKTGGYMANLIKKLLSPEYRLLSKHVFDGDGNLDMNNPLVQEALLKTDGFKKILVELVKKEHNKNKNKDEEKD